MSKTLSFYAHHARNAVGLRSAIRAARMAIREDGDVPAIRCGAETMIHQAQQHKARAIRALMTGEF